jgi:hypothetical protein
MTNVRTTQPSSYLVRFFTIPFLLLLVITLALDRLIAYTETPIGSAYAMIAKAHPSVVTIQRKNAQSTIALQNPLLLKAVL